MNSADLRRVRLLVTVSTVQFLTACVDFAPNCPFHSHCEGRRQHLCTNADEQYQHYQESYADCGEGKTCKEPLECVVSPLQPCSGSSCNGDLRTVCGASGYLTGTVEDCTKKGRICRESSSDAACVLADAPCPGAKSSFCSADQSMRYTGCDKGFGYALDVARCADCADSQCTRSEWASSGSRVCRESSSAAACVFAKMSCPEGKSSFCSTDQREYYTGCQEGFGYPLDTGSCYSPCSPSVCMESEGTASCADSPPTRCGSQEFACSADGKKSMRCKPGDAYYTCWIDCAQRGQVCVSSTGACSN